MPIKIDGGLSAVNRLREEGIVTIGKDRAMTQDIRPLKILILNLMPLKKPTELQLLRLLGNSPIQIEIDFCRPVSRVSTHTDNSYLDRVYLEWNDIRTAIMMASSSPAHQSKRLTLKMLNTGLNLSSTLSGPGAMSFLFSTIVGAPKLGYTITTIYQRSCSPKSSTASIPMDLRQTSIRSCAALMTATSFPNRVIPVSMTIRSTLTRALKC